MEISVRLHRPRNVRRLLPTLPRPRNEPEATEFARRAYHASPTFPVGDFDLGKWRQYRWAYYRMIEKIDTEIGRVLGSLRDAGHADNTLIVLTSDHGDCQGAHGWNQKTVFYDESVRVPFIIAAPRAKHFGTSALLVQTGIDFLPTLCDFAGVVPPTKLPGLSFRSAVEGSPGAALTDRPYIVSSNHFAQAVPVLGIKRTPAGRMLRSAPYKYCVYDQGGHRESLVDMENDPGEMVNLVGNPDFAVVLREHREMLVQWSRETGDTSFPLVVAK